MSFLKEYIYHVNNYCNLHCELCSDFCNIPIDKNSPLIERRVKWDAPLEEVELFCKRFKGIGMDKPVHLTGGEPTTIPENKFNAIMDVFHKYNRKVILLTNCYNIFGVSKSALNKTYMIKLDDHGINHNHIIDSIKYLKTFYKGKTRHIKTLQHFDLAKTRKLEINKGGHCARNTLITRIEILIKQGVVYPCCAMASFDLYNNDKRMEEELTKAGWQLDNPHVLNTVRNWKTTLPEYIHQQCRDGCWWPHKQILGGVKITKKPNDVIRKRDWRDFHEEFHNTSFLRKIDRTKAPIRLMIADEASKVGKSVLDVGCLSGIDYPIHLDKGLDYTGIDVAPKFLEHAKTLYPKINVRVGDILSIPYPDMSFDTVYCKDVLELMPPEQWKIAINELWRVSRRLMMIAFCEPPWDDPTNHFTIKRGKLVSWVSHYNKSEFMEFLINLPQAESVEAREPIKSLSNRDLALYLVRKRNG